MRKYSSLVMVMVMVVGLLMTSCSDASTKYDFITNDSATKKYIDIYDKNIKTSPVIMNYMNAIFDSPTMFYKELVNQDCDKEVLEFVKNNKSLSLHLAYVYVAISLSKMNVQDNELILVTNWIISPEAKLASSGDHRQAAVMLQSLGSFGAYEIYTKPGGLKSETEALFQRLLNHHNKSK